MSDHNPLSAPPTGLQTIRTCSSNDRTCMNELLSEPCVDTDWNGTPEVDEDFGERPELGLAQGRRQGLVSAMKLFANRDQPSVITVRTDPASPDLELSVTAASDLTHSPPDDVTRGLSPGDLQDFVHS